MFLFFKSEQFIICALSIHRLKTRKDQGQSSSSVVKPEFDAPGPTWQKETISCKLTSDLHTHAVAQAHPHTYTQ